MSHLTSVHNIDMSEEQRNATLKCQPDVYSKQLFSSESKITHTKHL